MIAGTTLIEEEVAKVPGMLRKEVVLAWALAIACPGIASGQASRGPQAQRHLYGTIGAGFIPQYPIAFRSEFDDVVLAAATGVGVSYRPTSWAGLESGLSLHLPIALNERDVVHVPNDSTSSTYDVLRYTSGHGLAALVEARIVAKPLQEHGRAYRLVGGAAYAVNRRSPAWLAGAGLEWARAHWYVAVDLERWWIRAPYETDRVDASADGLSPPGPGERIGEGRREIRMWQLRVTCGVGIM